MPSHPSCEALSRTCSFVCNSRHNQASAFARESTHFVSNSEKREASSKKAPLWQQKVFHCSLHSRLATPDFPHAILHVALSHGSWHQNIQMKMMPHSLSQPNNLSQWQIRVLPSSPSHANEPRSEGGTRECKSLGRPGASHHHNSHAVSASRNPYFLDCACYVFVAHSSFAFLVCFASCLAMRSFRYT